jgi:hypothetical protein
MSEFSPSAPEKAGPPKKPVSPARNLISLAVLVAVVVVGYFEVSAKWGYEGAAKKLDKWLEDDNKGLPSQEEAESMIGKSADDAGTEVEKNNLKLTKKTYTWKGLVGSYTLVAYYTKGTHPALNTYEAGKEAQAEPAPPAAAAPAGGVPAKAASKGMGKGKGQSKAQAKSEPGEKAAPEPTPPPPPDALSDEKATPEPKAEEKPKAATDEKAAPEPKAEEKPKPATDAKAKAG